MKCEHIDCVCWASCNMSIGSLSRPQPYLLNQWALFSVCGELTALLDFVSVGRGFSFIQRMRRSPSTSNIPYLRVSIKTRTEQKTVNSFCKVKLEAWFLPCVCFKNSPSSLHWYDSTRQLSSHFAWWLENVSFTLLRLKSSLNRVSLWMEKKLHQLEKQTLNSQLKQHLCDVILIMLTQWTHPPITKTWSSILKCFTASCRQATAPRRPWWKEESWLNEEI